MKELHQNTPVKIFVSYSILSAVVSFFVGAIVLLALSLSTI